jgi:hypothetical protein
MGYHIFETPDHLHRGLHLFAIDNLHVLLGWLTNAYSAYTSGRSDFFLNDRWLLWDVATLLKRKEQRIEKQPETQEVKQFFKQHPELIERPSHRIWKGPDPMPSVQDQRLLEDLKREHDEFEARGDESESSVVCDSVRSLQAAIATESIEEVCTGIEHLRGILGEGARRPQYVIHGLEAVHELISNGLRSDARIIDDDENEAFEVTKLCQGAFRSAAKKGVAALRSLSPTDFENFIAELLAQHGLRNVRITRIVADGGIDIWAIQFVDGKQLKYIIQCKRNAAKNKVTVGVVRELVGAKMDAGADHALLITTSEFTRPAKELARRGKSQAWGVRLVDHKLLQRLLNLTD